MEKIRAISIQQPWATLITLRTKTIETRSWKTSYRGDLLIVSSQYPDYNQDLFPVGVALCIARLVDVRPMVPTDCFRSLCSYNHLLNSWRLEDIVAIAPFSVRGMPGLYDVEIRTPDLLQLTEQRKSQGR